MLRIEVFSDKPDQLGEGPLWDVQSERFYWIDSYAPAVYSADLAMSDRRSWPMPEPIGSMALRRDGGALVALRSGFALLDFDTGEVTPFHRTHDGVLTSRLNDGKTDRQGRFIAGSMDHEESEPVGILYGIDADLNVSVLDQNIICSNGPCFSPDGTILYFADSFKRVIYAYDYDCATGTVQSRRIFASFDGFPGYPDGATVDAEGFLWCVEVYSGRLIRFDPQGAVDRVLGLPVHATTSIAFGGPDLDIAFITSMARPKAGQYPQEREAGMVFVIHGLGVTGIEEARFAG